MVAAIVVIQLLALRQPVQAQEFPLPDESFGKGGQVLSKIKPNTDDIGQAIAVQQDGKIVVAGNCNSSGGIGDLAVIRYKRNGQPDKSFNGTGKKIINTAFCHAVVIQPDGGIVLGGSTVSGNHLVFGLWRLNNNGAADQAFGINGEQKIEFPGELTCFALTIQPDGKILVAGHAGDFENGNAELVIVRINKDGQADHSFSDDGKFSLRLSGKSISCRKVLLQPDGKIVAAGQMITTEKRPLVNEFFAMRLGSDGAVDSSFGMNGIFSNRNSNSDHCQSAVLLPGGRIVLAGFSQFTGYKAASVLCLTPNGAVDHTFGSSGWVYPNYFGSNSAVINSMAIQGDGKIILAGNAGYSLPATTAITLARLNSDGVLDPAFGNGGMDTSFVSPADAIGCNGIALMAHDRIVVTGFRQTMQDYFMTVRFLNGTTLLNHVATETAPFITALQINPEPVQGNTASISFNIEAGDTVTIRLYNSSGREVMNAVSMQVEKGRTCNTLLLPDELSGGIYFCNVKSKAGVESISFEIER